jgi:hypothetical protein
MDLQSIEIFTLAAVVPPIHVVSGRFGINSASVDSNVFADLNRTAVDQKQIFGTCFLVDSTEPFKKRLQNRRQRMETPIVLAPAEPTSEIPLFGEQIQSPFEVSCEEASSHNRGGHHLRVGNFSLSTFLVASGLEPIVKQTVISGDSGVHGTGNLRERM